MKQCCLLHIKEITSFLRLSLLSGSNFNTICQHLSSYGRWKLCVTPTWTFKLYCNKWLYISSGKVYSVIFYNKWCHIVITIGIIIVLLSLDIYTFIHDSRQQAIKQQFYRGINRTEIQDKMEANEQTERLMVSRCLQTNHKVSLISLHTLHSFSQISSAQQGIYTITYEIHTPLLTICFMTHKMTWHKQYVTRFG